jgi:hypothetical protein
MDAIVINWKRFDSGALAGFFDLVVSGITITGCKAFRKDDRLWFAWPSEKTQDKDGGDKWREIVTASEPVMRHLQGLVRGQLRALLDGNGSAPGNGTGRKPAGRAADTRGSYRTPEGEDLSQYRSDPKDDIPF